MSTALSYYHLNPGEIKSLSLQKGSVDTEIMGVPLTIHRGVSPSHLFRSTRFLIQHLTPLFDNASVCDMGCGPGILGLHGIANGAGRVVMVDINEAAVANATNNLAKAPLHHASTATYHSDCFDSVPSEVFDIIAFNIPFHTEHRQIHCPLDNTFFDPEFQMLSRLLQQAQHYMHPGSILVLAFSDKGDVCQLESIMTESGFSWELWRRGNTADRYDSRLYRLSISPRPNLPAR